MVTLRANDASAACEICCNFAHLDFFVGVEVRVIHRLLIVIVVVVVVVIVIVVVVLECVESGW